MTKLSSPRRAIAAACLVPLIGALAPAALAQDREPLTASEPKGVNLDVGFATAYVFRGWNVFQEDSQLDPHGMIAPGLSWRIGDSNVTVGYWAAYQLTGTNIGATTDEALNAEQDLYVTYDLELPNDLAMAFGLTAYVYPAADPDVMGAAVPLYLEPSVGVTYSTAVDLGLSVHYLAGLQDQPSIWGYSYLYLHPTVGKSFDLNEHLALDLGLGYGFKLFNEGIEGRDNVHDVTVTGALPIQAGGPGAYVAPGLGLAWTNVEDVTDDSGAVIDDKGFADGIAVWGSLNLGMDL
ncbi:MAG: hypothetical protein JRI23_08075 [Deltaproteobacteria bacterium]|nr:hypothetical protein [Deltaproteobacteria bacterium]MBW2531569.1 hypothetical protein [Deltaproteobacteria bacterium]